MIDTMPQIKQALGASGLEVYHEHFVDNKTKLPCITYLEYDNNTLAQGDTLAYSNLVYHIKVWGQDLRTLTSYAAKVDDIMRKLGFTRKNQVELWLDGIGQLQLRYEGKAKEYFNKET